MKRMTNETIGISAEIAIADTFKISVENNYRKRGDTKTINAIKKIVKAVFSKYKIPKPKKHIAEKQNPNDFELIGGKTLSVKTNEKKLGKVAPQNVGQPTSTTYFEHFESIITEPIPKEYEKRRELFKKISVSEVDKVFTIYWQNLFHSDYYIHFYNVHNNVDFKVFGKLPLPAIKKSDFSFTHITKNKEWYEGTTLKYNDITIGEFQAHQVRDCFKFRFDIDGIIKAFLL